jgi:hypothetical protein
MNASEMARALGRKGGRARARRLSAAERKRIASTGGHARARSLRTARRIAENFRHVRVLEMLRPRPASIRRLSEVRGALPGIYRSEP